MVELRWNGMEEEEVRMGNFRLMQVRDMVPY